MTRQKHDPVEYSANEQRMLEFLISRASRREVSSSDIVEEWYDGVSSANRPYYGRQIVTGLIESLRKKLDHNSDKYVITKSRRSGPHPVRIRIARRQ
jgi:hypothetical protein